MIRILIADDEAYVRDLLVKNIIHQEGVEAVEVAEDGREALEKARDFRPDVLITDIAMPYINGLELIRRLQKETILCKSVVISGYDEFDYAKQAISLGVKDYLLKPFLLEEIMQVLNKIGEEVEHQKRFQHNLEFLQEQVKSGKNLVREKRIKSLLNGKKGMDDFSCWEREELEISSGCLCAGILKFYGTSWRFESQNQVEEFLDLLKDGYFSARMNLCAVSFEENSLALIWSIQKQDSNELKNFIRIGLERMEKSFEKYYGGNFRCYVGECFHTMEKIPLSYQQAVDLWKCSFDTKKSVIFFGEESEKKEEDLPEQIREWKSRICEEVRMAQTEYAIKDFRSLMRCYASFSTKRADYIRASIGELVYAIETEMENFMGEEQERKKRRLREVLEHASLVELEQILERYLKECCLAFIEHRETNRAQQMVRQVKCLIERNLENADLNLEWIEGQVHFSTSYIRQTFKQKMGESISEYLIRKRMERAGQLLGMREEKVQDVAKACGYENQRYFASSFKKFYGCTPTEFRTIVEKDPLIWMK